MGQEDLKNAIRSGTKDEDLLRFKEGEHLFLEGDRGGDLLLIEFGEVEVFKELGEHKIVLARMRQGELIGCFTCLTAAPRTASVRAVTATRCRVIRHDRIKKTIGGLPKWFSIILKEYGIRLLEVEGLLLERVRELAEARKIQRSSVYDGAQFCSALAGLAKHYMVTIEGEELVVKDDVVQAIAEVLGFPLGHTKKIARVILDAGLLLKKVEPDKNREVYPLTVVEKIVDFPKFLVLAKDGKSKRMVEARWSLKHFKLGRDLVRFARSKGLGSGAVKISFDALNEELAKVTGTQFSDKDLGPLLDFLLVKVVSEPNDRHFLAFHTAKLGRTLAHVRAFQMLAEIDCPKNSEVDGAEGVQATDAA